MHTNYQNKLNYFTDLPHTAHPTFLCVAYPIIVIFSGSLTVHDNFYKRLKVGCVPRTKSFKLLDNSVRDTHPT
ncbi:hypothetical protein [Alysiella crassa]|uniref:Uncharacterized protein n=1 Tax=Alysiella crassa TaxID=153491 RepID=A0A376BV65_9NEIS|nr:hypothetical protein [Alysiella crassa]UOP06336.1 hypothetical protein LVJ80_11145 [Alysiella crassa]SSY80846.1 Uncharacterised protein [Alysiella crassa]